MTRFFRMFIGAILLALVFNIGIVCAADGDADLNVTKVVSSTGPYETGDEITWEVTLWNNGPGNATNVSLTEDVSGMSGLVDITGVANKGQYDNSTKIWSIAELKNATFATLTLITSFNTIGEKTNNVAITAHDQTDPVSGNDHAHAHVMINAGAVIPDAPLSVDLTIKPTTLNLGSKGVFTVYISLNGVGPESSESNKKPIFDYDNSTLTCGEAELVRASVSNRDGGTLIAKFHRDELENVTTGDGIQINCSGTISVNGEKIAVEGSDTIRVIGEKKGLDKILSNLWKFLGIEKDDIEINESEDGNITVTFTLNPDNFKNTGQAKKALKALNNESDTGDVIGISHESSAGKEKGNSGKNNGNDKQINGNNANTKSQKGDGNTDEPGNESTVKSNGKKNK